MRALHGEPIMFNRRYQYIASPLRTSIRIHLPRSKNLDYELHVVNGTRHRLIVVRTFASLLYKNHVCNIQEIAQNVLIRVMHCAGCNYSLITKMNNEDDQGTLHLALVLWYSLVYAQLPRTVCFYQV